MTCSTLQPKLYVQVKDYPCLGRSYNNNARGTKTNYEDLLNSSSGCHPSLSKCGSSNASGHLFGQWNSFGRYGGSKVRPTFAQCGWCDHVGHAYAQSPSCHCRCWGHREGRPAMRAHMCIWARDNRGCCPVPFRQHVQASTVDTHPGLVGTKCFSGRVIATARS